MSDRLKTALMGAFAGFLIAVFVYFFFRDPEAGFLGNFLLLTIAPVGGFAGGWLGFEKK